MLEIYARYDHKVYAYIHRHSEATCFEDEEDLMETYREHVMKELRAGHYKEEEEPKMLHWLYTIAHNVVRRYWRKKQEHQYHAVFDEEMEEKLATPPITVQDPHLRKALGDVLWAMTYEERHIFFWKIWWNRSFKEIADLLRLEEGNVKMKYYRRCHKLALLLKDMRGDTF